MIVYLLASSISALATMNVAVTADGKWSFYQAYGWLSYGPQAAKDAAVAAIPNFQKAWSTGIASIVARGMGLDWLAIIIALGSVLWVANDIPPFLLVASRTFFAMSFDRMMPEKFAYVSEKWHAPVWSIIITAIVAIPACISEAELVVGGVNLYTYLQWTNVVGTDLFDAFFLTMFCVSCMLLPLERRDIYDRAAVKHSIGTVVTLGLVATIGAGFCLLVFLKESPWIYALITTGATEGDLASSIGFFLTLIVGLLIYLFYMYRNTTKGVDMRTLYLSIPPE
jgi:amino acid transporter